VGGTALVVHPRYLFGALEPTYYEAYKQRNRVRALSSYKAMSDMMIKKSLVKIKEHPPYVGDMERKVLLNSMARATLDPKTGEYSFKGKLVSEVPLDVANAKAFSAIAATNSLTDGSAIGVGVDQGSSNFILHESLITFTLLELISSVPSHNPTFVCRNFTDSEIAYCRSQPSPPSSFAARWVGKEAVFKSLGVKSKGAAAAMKDIEIVNDESGVPMVHLHGDAKASAIAKGISKILISLSHSEVSCSCIYAAMMLIVCIDCCYCICPSIVMALHTFFSLRSSSFISSYPHPFP
jgi:fatty acid synthase subunit alpha, fungi type